ncbi:MAG: hypothetical protein SGPRY_001000 [Prymnesium sp.]
MKSAPPSSAPPSNAYLAARTPPYSKMSVVPGAKWKEHYCCGYGSVTRVCICAWLMFASIPLLFYLFVSAELHSALAIFHLHPIPLLVVASSYISYSRIRPSACMLADVSTRSALAHALMCPSTRKPLQGCELLLALSFVLIWPTFSQVLPTESDVGPWVKIGFLSLYTSTAFLYLLAGCINPGVPNKPPPLKSDCTADPDPPLSHPGHEYTFSRDSSRYVKGFDHYCEFVGNDIGKGNMYCFVLFLAVLALLSTYIVIFSCVGVYFLWTNPPPVWHTELAPWRIAAALLTLLLLFAMLRKCLTSEVCRRACLCTLMAMPGAWCGAFMLFVVLIITIVTPFITDMFGSFSPRSNPIGFFLILPTLAFAVPRLTFISLPPSALTTWLAPQVLFWGMGLHWVFLIIEGVSQKLWLKAKGLRFGSRRGKTAFVEDSQATAAQAASSKKPKSFRPPPPPLL